jgi:iron complex outermembrane receptor protein
MTFIIQKKATNGSLIFGAKHCGANHEDRFRAITKPRRASYAEVVDRFRPRGVGAVLWIGLLLSSFTLALKGQVNPAGATGPTAFKNLSLEELSQIEVTTPSKEPVKAFQTPAAIYVITGEDIRRSGATSIPEALRLAPGVEVARIDGNTWSIGIRGFGSNLTRSVLVLIDGRTVYTPLFAGTNWDVQNVLLDDVDRIEVIRGPGGTIWGPNAVNGVINIISKDSKDTKGVLVSAGGGNEEQGFLNFRYGGGNGKDFSYRVYGMGFTRSPEYHQDDRNFDDWRNVQGGFRMDWKEDRDTFTLQGDLYDEAAGKSVGATSYTPPYSQTIDANALLSGGNVLGRWKRILGDGQDIQFQVYYDRTDRHTPNYIEIRNTFDLDYLQRARLGERQEISWGLGLRVDPVSDPVVVSGLQFVPNNRTDYLATGFIQDEIKLVDRRLSLTLGTKLLRTNFTQGVSPEPSARLLWTPSEQQSVWGAFTHALRTPSDSEENFSLLGYIGTAAGGTPYFARFNANPNFASEQLNGYELGYRRLLGPKLYVDVSSFYNHYHDLFSEDITGPPSPEATPTPAHLLLPAQFRNGLLGYTKGVEIAPEWSPKNFWRLRGSYSYLHMNLGRSPNSGDIGTGPIIVGSSPGHEATIRSSFDLSKAWQLDLTYRYVSALPGQMVPAYSTGDARLGWRFNRYVDLSIVGQNLFQPWHVEYGGDPGPLIGIKRSVYAKLTWSR